MNTLQLQRPVCILAVGLIGGSLMRDLRRADCEVFGWNRSPAVVQAARDEGFEVYADLTETLQLAEQRQALLVIGTPMTVVGSILDAIATHAPTCGITDVVSVKGAVQDAVDHRGMSARYVGAHPMAGAATSGWDASREGLFDGAAWVVTYDLAAKQPTPPETWLRTFADVIALGKTVGSDVIPALASNHDRAVASISHVPHLAAYAVAAGAEDDCAQLALSLAAGSFRDGTRVAAAEPAMVMSWCENNVPAVLDSLDALIARLQQARTQLSESGTATQLAESGFAARARYEARGTRPVIHVNLAHDDWLLHLRHAESIGGRIEIS